MNILAQWGGLWGFFTLMTHTPSYFKMVHGWNIRSVSNHRTNTRVDRAPRKNLHSSFYPLFPRRDGCPGCLILCGWVSPSSSPSWGITSSGRTKWAGRTWESSPRQFVSSTPLLLIICLNFIVPGCIGQGLCMLGLSFSGCNHMAAIVFLTLATASHGAVSTGPLASFVDISPNYASEYLKRYKH